MADQTDGSIGGADTLGSTSAAETFLKLSVLYVGQLLVFHAMIQMVGFTLINYCSLCFSSDVAVG